MQKSLTLQFKLCIAPHFSDSTSIVFLMFQQNLRLSSNPSLFIALNLSHETTDVVHGESIKTFRMIVPIIESKTAITRVLCNDLKQLL